MSEKILQEILKRLEDLESRIEELEKKESPFTTLEKAETLSKEKDVMQEIKPFLERAADAAITDFKVNPPKRR